MKKTIRIIFFLGISLFAYYIFFFEPNNIKIEKQTILLENLPRSSNERGVKIAHLSDLQSLWFGSREKRVLKMLDELKPDFVFITGDFVDTITKMITDKKLNSVKIFWQELGKKYNGRIFAVLGNHDTKLVKNYLKESGIAVLENENQKLILNNNDNEDIYLIGVDPWPDAYDLEKALKGIKEDKTKILLSHRPEIMKNTLKNIDLILVGDTHGGQVNIPFLGKLIQPLSEYGRKYTKGLFKIDSTYLYVNRGIGTSFFPIRFNVPPEITLIKLKKDGYTK